MRQPNSRDLEPFRHGSAVSARLLCCASLGLLCWLAMPSTECWAGTGWLQPSRMDTDWQASPSHGLQMAGWADASKAQEDGNNERRALEALRHASRREAPAPRRATGLRGEKLSKQDLEVIKQLGFLKNYKMMRKFEMYRNLPRFQDKGRVGYTHLSRKQRQQHSS